MLTQLSQAIWWPLHLKELCIRMVSIVPPCKLLHWLVVSDLSCHLLALSNYGSKYLAFYQDQSFWWLHRKAQCWSLRFQLRVWPCIHLSSFRFRTRTSQCRLFGRKFSCKCFLCNLLTWIAPFWIQQMSRGTHYQSLLYNLMRSLCMLLDTFWATSQSMECTAPSHHQP